MITILFVAIVGALLGTVARFAVRGRIPGTNGIFALLGVIGASLLFWLNQALAIFQPTLTSSLLISAIGALVVIGIYSLLQRLKSLVSRVPAVTAHRMGNQNSENYFPSTSTPSAPASEPPRQTPATEAASDIFISYSSADRPTAQALADALGREGWSVWWDRVIPPGKSFDAVIEAALDSAKCVVVLWSRTSVNSDWVKTEASEAMRRRILIPALVEDVIVPLEFRRIQAASLIGWPSPDHPGFRSLLASVANRPALFLIARLNRCLTRHRRMIPLPSTSRLAYDICSAATLIACCGLRN